jgi:hypothetical protein
MQRLLAESSGSPTPLRRCTAQTHSRHQIKANRFSSAVHHQSQICLSKFHKPVPSTTNRPIIIDVKTKRRQAVSTHDECSAARRLGR